MALVRDIRRGVERAMRLRPVRAFQAYAARRGPILASGLAYHALFSVFAGVWVLFSIAGLVLTGDMALQQRLIGAIAETLPGLISWGGEEGAIDPGLLLREQTFSWTGIVALVGLVFTALGFLSSARDAIRDMFGLPAASGNFVLTKLTDAAYLLGFLVVVLVSTALSVAGTAATGLLLDLIGLDSGSALGIVGGRVVSLALVVAIDTAVVAALLTLLAGVRVPLRRLWTGALIGGAGIAVLTVLFQLGVIGGVGSNPLLGSFVVILGPLVFFNFVCQAILVAASFVATELADAGIPLAKEAVRMPRHARVGVAAPAIRKAR